MLSVKTRLKIENTKSKLIATWYKLMKPIAYLIRKHEKWQGNIYKKKMKKVEQWSTEYVIKLYAKELVTNIVKMAKYNRSKEEIFVCDKAFEDYDNAYTILAMMQHSKNKDISEWVYRKYSIFDENLEINRMLTDLLQKELKRYDNIEAEYVIHDKLKNGWDMKGYEKTLAIKLNMNK